MAHRLGSPLRLREAEPRRKAAAVARLAGARCPPRRADAAPERRGHRRGCRVTVARARRVRRGVRARRRADPQTAARCASRSSWCTWHFPTYSPERPERPRPSTIRCSSHLRDAGRGARRPVRDEHAGHPARDLRRRDGREGTAAGRSTCRVTHSGSSASRRRPDACWGRQDDLQPGAHPVRSSAMRSGCAGSAAIPRSSVAGSRSRTASSRSSGWRSRGSRVSSRGAQRTSGCRTRCITPGRSATFSSIGSACSGACARGSRLEAAARRAAGGVHEPPPRSRRIAGAGPESIARGGRAIRGHAAVPALRGQRPVAIAPRVRASAVDPGVDRGAGAAHRGLERREPVSGADRRTRARDGPSPVDRRRPRTADPAGARRKRARRGRGVPARASSSPWWRRRPSSACSRRPRDPRPA